MLISHNRFPPLEDFETLVNSVVDFMNREVKSDTAKELYYQSRNGAKLEEDVYKILREKAKGTDFEDTIKLVSSQSFPDIVAGRYYGVEVKTSKKNWKSVGSSIMESSRIQDVDYIYMFFGRLSKDVEFRAASYEECLSGIVVTHSPRYSIDMELAKGETIFEKMDIQYEVFRNIESPISLVKDYYRASLNSGEDLWWMTSNEQALSPVVRLWNTLSPEERMVYKVKGFCWFPEIFSPSPSKYNKFAIWLTTQNGIIPTALRDIYTAGGREDILTQKELYENQPQIISQLNSNKSLVMQEILNADEDWIKEMWGVNRVLEGQDRLRQWINVVVARGERKIGPILHAIFNLEI